MPKTTAKKSFQDGEVDSIQDLLSKAGRYFLHPDVLTWLPDAAEKEADLQEISRHLETSRRTLKAKDARLIMLSLQAAADVLQAPDNPGQRFALSSSVVAWRLQEVIRRLKNFT